MATLPVAQQQAVISLVAYLGAPPPYQQAAVNYESAETLMGSIQDSQSFIVNASTTNQAVNLATMFPAALNPVIVFLGEITNPATGFSFTTVSGSGKQLIMPGGFVCWTPTATTTIYVDNNATSEIILQVRIISN